MTAAPSSSAPIARRRLASPSLRDDARPRPRRCRSTRWLGRAGAVDERVARPRPRPGARRRLRPRTPRPRARAPGGARRSASTSPRPRSRWRAARGATRPRGVDLRSPSRGPGAGTARCCSTATSASAATPDALLRRLAGLLAPRRGGRSSSSTRRASASCASGVRLEDGARASEWFAWARVGADAVDGPARAAGPARDGRAGATAGAGSRELQAP